MFSQETMKRAFYLADNVLILRLNYISRPAHQVVETRYVVAQLYRKTPITVEPLDEEAILFFLDRDALDANLIQHLA